MSPEGFSYQVRKNGDVVISHHGRVATTLRAAAARDFLDAIDAGDAQEVMARVTGNYKRGNEWLARAHPRNRASR